MGSVEEGTDGVFFDSWSWAAYETLRDRNSVRGCNRIRVRAREPAREISFLPSLCTPRECERCTSTGMTHITNASSRSKLDAA
jgi:hypothetical protein